MNFKCESNRTKRKFDIAPNKRKIVNAINFDPILNGTKICFSVYIYQYSRSRLMARLRCIMDLGDLRTSVMMMTAPTLVHVVEGERGDEGGKWRNLRRGGGECWLHI